MDTIHWGELTAQAVYWFRWLLAAWLVAINLGAYAAYGIDKSCAKRGKRRISERALFLWVWLGGGLGGWIGMRRFRHKTKHWYFVWGVPLITVTEYALLVWLCWTIYKGG